MSDRARLAVVTGAAGFIGSHMVDLLLERGYRVHGIDNLSDGRAREPANSIRSEPEFVLRDARRASPARRRCVLPRRRLRVPLRRHRRHRAVDRPTPRLYSTSTSMGTVPLLEAARHAGVRKFVYAASSSCYGSRPSCRPPSRRPIRPEYPYALSKYQGEEAVLHWGQVYKLAGGLDPHLQRLRAAFEHDRRLRRRLRRFPRAEARGQAAHRRRRRHAAPRFRLRRPMSRAPSCWPPNRTGTSEVYNLGAGNPQSVNRLVELLGGEVVHVPEAAGRAGLHLGRHHARSRRAGLGAARSPFEDGRRRMLEQYRPTGASARCGTRRRSRRRRRPGSPCSRGIPDDRRTRPTSLSTTAARSRRAMSCARSSARGLATRRSSCATARSTSSIRAIFAT